MNTEVFNQDDLYDDCPANVSAIHIPSSNYTRISVYTNCNSLDQFYGLWIVAGGPDVTFDEDDVAEFEIVTPDAGGPIINLGVSFEAGTEAIWLEYLMLKDKGEIEVG